MNQHTPGPWKHHNGRIFSADRESLTIAHVARAADGDYSPANGDVLAAAPELLEALRALISDPRMSEDEDSTVIVCWEDVRAARAAIARATGSQL